MFRDGAQMEQGDLLNQQQWTGVARVAPLVPLPVEPGPELGAAQATAIAPSGTVFEEAGFGLQPPAWQVAAPPVALGPAGSGGKQQRHGGSATGDPPCNTDRRAATRERNRLAQQRFREGARQRRTELESQVAAMEREVAAMRLENERLAADQVLMQKLLRVRGAMMMLGSMMGEPVQEEEGEKQQQEAEGQWGAGGSLAGETQLALLLQGGAGSGGSGSGSRQPVATHQPSTELIEARDRLMLALDSLPPPHELELLAQELQPSPRGTGAGANPAGAAEDPAAVQVGAAPRSTAAACIATGTTIEASADAATLPPSVLPAGTPAPMMAQTVQLVADGCADALPLAEYGVPAADKPTVSSMVEGMQGLEDVVAYWQGWRERVCQAYSQAREGGFGDVRQLESLNQDMVQLFWHLTQLKPRLSHAFLLAILPPSTMDASTLWRRVAEESLALLSEEELVGIERAWRNYMRRLAVAAAGVRPVAAQLQKLSEEGGSCSMAQLAERALQVHRLASRLKTAHQEQYVAAMVFLAELGEATGIVVRCLWHVAPGAFMPDHPAIVGEILRLRQEARQSSALKRLRQDAAADATVKKAAGGASDAVQP